MLAAAVVPAGSELVMIYAGALAGGTFAAHVSLFGHRIDSHAWAYVTLAATGAIANTIGCALGWAIGLVGGRPLLERARWLHVTPERIARAERWFERFGELAVPVGLA